MVRTGRPLPLLSLGLALIAVGVGAAPLRAQEAAKGVAPALEPPGGRIEAPAGSKADPEPAPRGAEARKGGAEAPAEAARAPEGAVGRASLLALVRQANPMLWPLGLCSVVAVGFILERLFALRRRRVLPRDFVQRFLDRLSQGKLDRERALELCRSNDSPVARIFGHVVRYWGQPAATIRVALEQDAAGELMDLRRNVRGLNATATLAPLLGLLGTVIGMIEAFDALGSRTAGAAKSEALAHGISLALMATAIGLGIAVASVAAYYYFLHRVDSLARELDDQARQVIDLVAADPTRVAAPAHDRRHVASGLGEGVRHELRTS